MRKNNDFGLLILRITIGLLMLLHGFAKFNGALDYISGMLVEKGLPGFFSYGVLVGEILAPIAIIVGFRTRIAALIYAFNCFVAALMAHSADIFKMGEHGSWALELLGLYFFTALVLFFTGGGKYSASTKSNWD